MHEKHGLGIYKGIEKVAVDKVAKDYIKIEYRNGSNLYILATQLDALQKYSGAETAKPPKLNRLGGQEWKKDEIQSPRCRAEYCKGTCGALCSPPGKRRLCLWTRYRLAARV